MVDTNILVSAALSRFGNKSGLFKAVEAGQLALCVSDDISAEYKIVLTRSKFAHFASEAASILATVSVFAEKIPSASALYSSLNPADTFFIDCAVTAKADYFVTGNKRHFPKGFNGSTEVVNTRQLLSRLPHVQ